MSESRRFRFELQCKGKAELNVLFLQEGYYHLVFRERDENDITVFQRLNSWTFMDDQFYSSCHIKWFWGRFI